MKYPTKPYPPYKPRPPEKKIEQKVILGTQSSQEDSEFTIASMISYIQENFPNIDYNKVKISFEIDKEGGYYDDVYVHLNIHYSIMETTDNTHYDTLYKSYKKMLSKYEKDFEQYKIDLEKYIEDEKQYKADLELLQVKQARAIIAKHEKKINKLNKKEIDK